MTYFDPILSFYLLKYTPGILQDVFKFAEGVAVY